MRARATLAALPLIAACGDDPTHDVTIDPPGGGKTPPRLVPAPVAIDSANVPTLDPHTMDGAEVERVLPQGPSCSFSYTVAGKPVVAAAVPEGGGPARGVVKINGLLVELRSLAPLDPGALAAGAVLQAEGLRFTIEPGRSAAFGGGQVEADAVMTLRDALVVGYAGYYICRG